MPIVTVKMGPGRTEAERMACARAVATAIADTIEYMKNEPMIISVMEMTREEWTEAAATAPEGGNAGPFVELVNSP